jgi:magnesium chelatase family protein
VRERVERARAAQHARCAQREVAATTNGALSPRDLERVASLCAASARMLSSAVERLSLSARAYGKILRVARTIADLDGASALRPEHVAEAIGLRVLDRRVEASPPPARGKRAHRASNGAAPSRPQRT